MQIRVRDNCCSDLADNLEPGLFKALSDPNRLELLIELSGAPEPMTVSDAAGCCEVDLSVVSRHLATLRQAGVVQAEKKGRQVYYSLSPSELANRLRAIADSLEACCPSPKENPND